MPMSHPFEVITKVILFMFIIFSGIVKKESSHAIA